MNFFNAIVNLEMSFSCVSKLRSKAVFKINSSVTFSSASGNVHTFEETMTDRLIEIGKCRGIEMNVKKIKAMRTQGSHILHIL